MYTMIKGADHKSVVQERNNKKGQSKSEKIKKTIKMGQAVSGTDK